MRGSHAVKAVKAGLSSFTSQPSFLDILECFFNLFGGGNFQSLLIFELYGTKDIRSLSSTSMRTVVLAPSDPVDPREPKFQHPCFVLEFWANNR